jgi:hypothetical protein
MGLPRSPWRPHVLWLVLGLPAATLAASALMIHLALQDPADSSGGRTQRIAQIQMEDLGPDLEASRRRVRATMQANPESGSIRVLFDRDLADTRVLELAMLHPSRTSEDRRVILVQVGSTWRGHTSPWPADQRWAIRLADAAGGWRIAGRWTPPSVEASLVPAVEP